MDGPDLIAGEVAKDKRIGWLEEQPPKVMFIIPHADSSKIVYGIVDFIKEAQSNRAMDTGQPVLTFKLDREGLFEFVGLANEMLEEWNRLNG